MTHLKVAIVHDWLTGYRGGERVLEAILELYPNAPLYTLVHVKGSVPQTIESHPIKTSFLQKMPAVKTKYRHYLPLFPFAAETLIDDNYDLIISTSHAVAKSIKPRKAKHWCYIHSPMRYVWDRFDDYFGVKRVGWLACHLFFEPLAGWLRRYDATTSVRVNHFVANSSFVAERVRKFYHREAEVINPPVAVEKFEAVRRNPKDYYLFFSALVPYKRADLAILACQKLGRKLKVVGSGPELKFLKSIVTSDLIQFHERPTDEEVMIFYSEAKALIFPAVEDFGIVPVEATASGLPLIGLKEGGLLDSQDDETCIFFDRQDVDVLSEAIVRFESTTFNESAIRAKAKRFSKTNFQNRVSKSIQSLLKRENPN